jgi:hypothetical protein
MLRWRVRALGAEHDLDLDLGAHISTVAEGAFGLGGAYEIVGMGVIHLFRMGGDAGTRISEPPVYRMLPSDRRSPWRKRQPPAIYALEH